MITNEPNNVLHGVKPFPNPEPKRNPGGDCFACALKAVVDYFYPEKPIDFDTAWECFQREQTNQDGSKSTHLTNHWGRWGFESAVSNLYHKGYSFETEPFLLHPKINIEQYSHAWGWFPFDQDWSQHAEAWLSNGWVMLVEMSLDPVGPFDEKGYHNHPDHFAIIDGQKRGWYKRAHSGSGTTFYSGGLVHESHLVCSARGGCERWIETKDLLHKHGVNGALLIRKDTRIHHYNNLSDDKDVRS
jgi:hypothetical protein